jgi:hypothetical protein
MLFCFRTIVCLSLKEAFLWANTLFFYFLCLSLLIPMINVSCCDINIPILRSFLLPLLTLMSGITYHGAIYNYRSCRIDLQFLKRLLYQFLTEGFAKRNMGGLFAVEYSIRLVYVFAD